MAGRSRSTAVALDQGLLDSWSMNERVTQYMLEHLDEKIWRAAPPDARGRTVAEIAVHIQNVRRMLLVMHGKKAKIAVPGKLDRHRATSEQTCAALAKSAQAVSKLLEDLIAAGGRVAGRAGGVAALFTGLVAHEAHHRGQICMLARQLGHALSPEAHLGMWDWNKRWKEAAGR